MLANRLVYDLSRGCFTDRRKVEGGCIWIGEMFREIEDPSLDRLLGIEIRGARPLSCVGIYDGSQENHTKHVA